MYRYIIVDDEALIRKGTLKKISPLSDLVTCIGEAENGSDALEQIEEKKPDFVIMDMQMPVMNGMELLPILAEKYPRMPLIVISGYKNFDYIKQAISANAVEYLLKPFSAQMIQDCIHQVLNRLEERTERDRQLKLTEEEAEQVRYEYDLTLLHNLIFGYRTAGTTLTSRKLNYINTTHDVLLINLCYPEPLDDSVLFQWLAENGFGDLGLYLSGRDTAQSQGFLILFLSQQAEKYQERLVKQVLDALELFLDSFAAETIIGVSLIHHSLSDLSQAYVEASHAPDAHILTDHRTHLFRFTKESTPQRLDWPRTDEFLFRLEAGMRGEIGPLCDDLFAYYLSVPSATLGDAKYHCASLSGYCRQLLNTYMKIPETGHSSATMESAASHIFSLEGLKKYYLQFFMNVTIMLKPHSIYGNEDVIENVKTYIQKNYQKNLTQDFLASLFYMNRSYLSSLFRSRTGEKFVDYLCDVRIERAEELLENPDQKLAQIARSVGYDNEKYFFRIFKKRTGMTPDQYRKELSAHE